MSISKIALIAFFVIGMQPIMQAYDAIMLKDQVAAIAKYAQELRTENNPQSLQLATWLEKRIADSSNTTDNDIIVMGTVIDKYVKIEQQTKTLRYIVGTLSTILAGATLFGGHWLKFMIDKEMQYRYRVW